MTAATARGTQSLQRDAATDQLTGRPCGEKLCIDGTHRARTLEDTLAWVTPQLARFGITRVANVTGLDHIGIPVVMVVRPNGKSLSVSQGKGLTMDAAKASGIMESIEAHHAENIDLPVRFETYRRLERTESVVDVTLLPQLQRSTWSPDKRMPWIQAASLRGQAAVWVPLEIVDLDMTVPWTYARHNFASSSNGLASGNTHQEAVLHGLSEVIERDCHAMWDALDQQGRDATRLDLSTVNDPSCRELLDRFDRADMRVAAWDATNDLGLPCVIALIGERVQNPFRRLARSQGAGCHPDVRVALSRALTEAAQSRLTSIVGSRDDKTMDTWRQQRSAGFQAATEDVWGSEKYVRPLDDRNIQVRETFSADIDDLWGRLQRAQLPEPVVVDLTKPDVGIPVVKVVAPGLEQKNNAAGQILPGARALATRVRP